MERLLAKAANNGQDLKMKLK